MAHVRITETLVEATESSIERMLRAAITALGEAPPLSAVAEHVAELAQVEAYKPAPHLLGQLPEAWLGEVHFVELHVFDEQADCVVSSDRYDFDGKLKLPGTTRTRYTHTVRANKGDLSGELLAWVEQRAEYNAETARLRSQYGDVAKQVCGFLRGHKSLNKAMKAMPELEMYIPQEYMDKLNTPTAKRQAQEPDEPAVEVDRDQLAALGVAHRLASARS